MARGGRGWGLLVGAAVALLLAGCGEKAAVVTPVPTATGAAAGQAAGQAAAGACWTAQQQAAPVNGHPQWSAPPAMVIDPAKTYTATLQTSKGTVIIQLLPSEAPATVNNFVCLARAGFYDNTTFHRIVAGFVIQGGDPKGNGTGGPGYLYNGETPRTLGYDRGIVAMANSNGPSTNGSQFFVCLADLNQQLPKNYTIFGRVTAGMDVVDATAAVPTHDNGQGEKSAPDQPVVLQKVTISES